MNRYFIFLIKCMSFSYITTIKCKICHKNHVLDKKNTFKEIDNLPA